MTENLAVLRAEIERLGLQGGPPDLTSWRMFLRQVEVLLEEREVRIETLEELAAFSTGELSRVRQHLAGCPACTGPRLEPHVDAKALALRLLVELAGNGPAVDAPDASARDR